tara:strand:- start:230 stop:547 length:318 start_codon:yes stop_codon:yes gene_type:complete
MAHYAFITNGIVTEVIAGIDETELIEGLDPETWYGNFRNQTCKRTSFNGRIRANYAGVGYVYDSIRDVFIAPKPECGHKELFLNDLFQWNCQRCELDTKANLSDD